MYCKSCGKQLHDGSVFCTECGANQEHGNIIAAKKIKMPIYKKWWFWVGAVLFLLATFGNPYNRQLSTIDLNEYELSLIQPPPVDFGTKTSVVISDDNALHGVVDVFDVNLSLEFESDEYLIHATDNGITIYFRIQWLSLQSVQATRGRTDEWDETKQSFLDIRKELQRILTASSRHDSITIVVLNDANVENNSIILAISHGNIIYDAAAEQKNSALGT